MAEPVVIQMANQFRDGLLEREQKQMLAMAERWLQIEKQIEQYFISLSFELVPGELLTFSQFARLERYQMLLQQIKTEMDRYNQYVSDIVFQQELLNMSLGILHGYNLIQASGIEGGFNRISISSVEFMAGFAADGTPLAKLLEQSYGDVTNAITQHLINGIALGINPVTVARRMRDSFGMAFDRALRIARTEQLRAYRIASLDQYRGSGVVRGYRRVAAKSIRTCMACLIADGKYYPLDVPFEEHPHGRCTPIPVIVGQSQLDYQTGKDWFLKQPQATQQKMMGPGAFNAWKAGKFDLDRIVMRKENETWGNSLIPRPLHDLLADS